MTTITDRLAATAVQAIELIAGDLTGTEWKRECYKFVNNAKLVLAAYEAQKAEALAKVWHD